MALKFQAMPIDTIESKEQLGVTPVYSRAGGMPNFVVYSRIEKILAYPSSRTYELRPFL